MKLMEYVRWAALGLLMSMGLSAVLVTPHTPVPPRTKMIYPATARESLDHDLELARQRDQVRGWETEK
jgi:hypothetical protein